MVGRDPPPSNSNGIPIVLYLSLLLGGGHTQAIGCFWFMLGGQVAPKDYFKNNVRNASSLSISRNRDAKKGPPPFLYGWRDSHIAREDVEFIGKMVVPLGWYP